MSNTMDNQEMDIDAISIFVKVVEQGSLSAAARLLGRPKTTVSAKLAALEKRLGVTLIQRTTRKLHVTEQGRNFFDHCALAIQEIEKGESEISASQEKPRGLIKITAPADLGHSLLPKIVSQYMDQYPETKVEMIVTNRIVDLIKEGVDLAIRAAELKDSTMIAKKFFQIQAGFWASAAYLKKNGRPSHPKDLHHHKLILHSNFRSGPVLISDEKNSYQLPSETRLKADDFEAIQELVYLDAGIAILPEFLVRRSVRSVKLEPVLPQWRLKNPGHFYFVYPGQRYASPKVRAFIELASSMKGVLSQSELV